MPYLRIDPLKADVGRVADVMSVHYAESRCALPVQMNNHDVVIATAEPFDLGWVAEIEAHTRRSVKVVLANPQDVRKYTTEFYALAKSVRAAQKSGEVSPAASFEQLVELGKTAKQLDANDQGVVQVVDWLWQYAFDQRASDIHLEPRRDMGAIRFRIDGVLHTVYQVPLGVMNAMTSRIKLLGRMDVVERRRPLDGRIKTKRPDTADKIGAEVEMRLSTLPTAFGEKLVMRIFDPETAVKRIEALGFGAHDTQRWQELIARPHGIILVTGPTGSGKTTTLYSTLKQLATDEVNVCTIEDPIEMIEPAFNQTQVHAAIDMGFAEGPARADAPGPGHHHGRRDPRPGHRRDGDPGGADRPPGVQHAAHQRLGLGHHAPGRPGRAGLPDLGHGGGRAGAAPDAHAVPGLQAA